MKFGKPSYPHGNGREYLLQIIEVGFHIIRQGFICQAAEQHNHRSVTSSELKDKFEKQILSRD